MVAMILLSAPLLLLLLLSLLLRALTWPANTADVLTLPLCVLWHAPVEGPHEAG